MCVSIFHKLANKSKKTIPISTTLPKNTMTHKALSQRRDLALCNDKKGSFTLQLSVTIVAPTCPTGVALLYANYTFDLFLSYFFFRIGLFFRYTLSARRGS